MREWEYGRLPFFILTLNVSILFKVMITLSVFLFWSRSTTRKLRLSNYRIASRIINDSMLGFAISF